MIFKGLAGVAFWKISLVSPLISLYFDPKPVNSVNFSEFSLILQFLRGTAEKVREKIKNRSQTFFRAYSETLESGVFCANTPGKYDF